MKNSNPQIDAYIAKSAPFAQPILKKARKLFHQACPQIEEKIKWGFPSFEYKGMVGGFAAFKQHATFGFWKQGLLKDPRGYLKAGQINGMGTKLTSVKDLPPDKVILDFIRQAVALNENGIKVARKPAGPAKRLPVPADLKAALAKNKKAAATFESFPPSSCNDYVQWLVEAKQEETRARRLATTMEWLAEGKPRHWKYMKKK